VYSRHDQRNKLVLDESVPVIGADKVQRGEGLKLPYTGAALSRQGLNGVNEGARDGGPPSL
jgi:hypothetical protein